MALSLSLIITGLKINELKNIEYQKPEFLSDKKIITIYFSNSKNTEQIANNIYSAVGGDIELIQPKEKYPKDIIEISKTVNKQMKQGYLPDIKDIDISNYDVVFVGSPVWNLSVSLPVKSFLKNHNFENKTVVPFFTYGTYANKNKLTKEIKDLANTKNIKETFLINGNFLFLAKERTVNWLNKL